jgi:phosphatidylglycerophosphate synthase
MENEQAAANRRPLKSRSTRWAALATRAALSAGLSANQVSFLGIVVSVAGALALYESFRSVWLFLLAAVCIQLRLLANMVDGLVAIEGGRGGPTGGIWNEFPDRLEDSLLLVGAGYAASMPELGWLAALLAAICAYVRLLGGTLGQPQDFAGPMAKPHRMAALTIGCLLAFATILETYDGRKEETIILIITLALISFGTALTITRRLIRLSKTLRA